MKTAFFTSILISILFLVSCQQSEKKHLISGTDSVSYVKYEIKINGMTCTGCEQTIQGAVAKLDGINSIKASHTDSSAYVEFDMNITDTNQIKQKIANTGYTVVAFVAEK